MKAGKITLLQFRWRIKYSLRTTLAAAGQGLRRFGHWLTRVSRLCWGGARRAWRAAGYYVALALLLTLLGSAAYAYRQRPRALPKAVVPTPVPAAAQETPAAVAAFSVPGPTPTPFALLRPVPGEILRPFDIDSLSWSETLRQWQTHPGVDFFAERGEAVCAAEAGEVAAAYRDPLLGNVIELRHDNGAVTRYASLNTLNLVKIGARVARGDIISAAGDSSDAEAELGPHLHFEYLVDGQPSAPEFAAEEAVTE